jgi:transglutaminase-like putative cysteine protease
MRVIFIFLFLLSTFIARAGNEPDFHQLKVKYGSYNAVISNMEYFYDFDVDKDSLKVSFSEKKQVVILNEHSKSFTNDEIFYSSFTTLGEHEAYTLVPNGRRYREIGVQGFQEVSKISDHVFYDDSKSLNFSYPSLQQGAITNLEYTLTYRDPRFIRKSFFQSFVPVVKAKVTARVHRDVKIGYKLINADKANIRHKQYSKGRYTYHEWEVTGVDPYNYYSSDSYNINHFSPHVVLYVKSTHIDDETKNYFGEIEDLYRYYKGFISDLNTSYNPELREFVNNLTSGLTDEKKAKTIYYWVQRNIKYVAYEQGYMGYRPASANEVFSKRFGDCKGMSSLINGMMELAGLDASIAWVGTRRIPYTYDQLPLPQVDNHMVAAHYTDDKNIYILDGTFDYLDYGIYPFHIQGKEVLIAKDEHQFEIFKVPVSPVSYSTITDSVSISMHDGLIKGAGKVIHTGFNKMELASALDGVKEANYDKSLTRILNKGNNKFSVKGHHIHNLFDYDKPAEVDYQFDLHDYSRQIGDELFINLNLDKSYGDLSIDTTGIISPVENDFYCTETIITSFEIPEGYEVIYIPQDGEFESDSFSASFSYRKEDGVIILEKQLKFEFFVLLDDQISCWNNLISYLNQQYRSSIALKKTDTKTSNIVKK